MIRVVMSTLVKIAAIILFLSVFSGCKSIEWSVYLDMPIGGNGATPPTQASFEIKGKHDSTSNHRSSIPRCDTRFTEE